MVNKNGLDGSSAPNKNALDGPSVADKFEVDGPSAFNKFASDAPLGALSHPVPAPTSLTRHFSRAACVCCCVQSFLLSDFSLVGSSKFSSVAIFNLSPVNYS
ncbi:hypothetical protein BJ742DRAFT_746251 [Cladochytrium replicatum]|nr:hypothetical protein BJ742DRAFT_746251 [Cladochytrium replicatum]